MSIFLFDFFSAPQLETTGVGDVIAVSKLA